MMPPVVQGIKRTLEFQLWINEHERAALDRVVENGGFANASEALRYLIRKADESYDDPASLPRSMRPADDPTSTCRSRP